jgi:hypothetical protein
MIITKYIIYFSLLCNRLPVLVMCSLCTFYGVFVICRSEIRSMIESSSQRQQLCDFFHWSINIKLIFMQLGLDLLCQNPLTPLCTLFFCTSRFTMQIKIRLTHSLFSSLAEVDYEWSGQYSWSG